LASGRRSWCGGSSGQCADLAFDLLKVKRTSFASLKLFNRFVESGFERIESDAIIAHPPQRLENNGICRRERARLDELIDKRDQL